MATQATCLTVYIIDTASHRALTASPPHPVPIPLGARHRPWRALGARQRHIYDHGAKGGEADCGII